MNLGKDHRLLPLASPGSSVPEPAIAVAQRSGSPLFRFVRDGWNWLQSNGKLRVLQPKTRRLRVSETVSLGEKRFVSIVEVDGASFLIGGSSTSVSLLTTLDEKPATPTAFQGAMSNAWRAKETA